jgi:hypothetical protein
LFEKTTGTQTKSIPKSTWQIKAGFTKAYVKEEDVDSDIKQGE